MKKLLLPLLLSLLPVMGMAQDTSENISDPEILIQTELDKGNVVIAQWWTDWCSTCQRQKRIIADLKENNDYSDLYFIEINYDEWGQSFMAAEQGVVRRSTLVSLNKEGVIDLQIAQTKQAVIKDFLDNAQKVANDETADLKLLPDTSQQPALTLGKTLAGETCNLC